MDDMGFLDTRVTYDEIVLEKHVPVIVTTGILFPLR